MKRPLVLVGLVLFLAGAGLMVFGTIRYRDTDPVVEIGELEITKTETREKRIPVVVTGGLMGVGAALAVIGALRKGP